VDLFSSLEHFLLNPVESDKLISMLIMGITAGAKHMASGSILTKCFWSNSAIFQTGYWLIIL